MLNMFYYSDVNLINENPQIFSIALIVVGAVCIYKLHELETIFDDK